MTLEQLMSPVVTEWIDNFNKRLNEGYTCTSEEHMEQFEKWFIENEDRINESVKEHNVLNEGRFDDVWGDDDKKEDEPIEEEPVEDEPVSEPESEPVVEKPKTTSKGKVKVTNSKKNPYNNVFNAVNSIYKAID